MNLFRKPYAGYLVLAYYLGFLALVGALYLVNRTQRATLGGSLVAIGILLLTGPAVLWLAYYRVVLPLAWLARMGMAWGRHQRTKWSLALAALVGIWLFGVALALWTGYLLVGLLALAVGLGLLSIAYELRVELIASLNERHRKHAQGRNRTAR